MRRTVLAVLVALPLVAYAAAKYRAAHACPLTPDCPCAHKK
jgi:hypothetical protein